MSFGQMVEFWFARHLVVLIIAVVFFALLFLAALVSVFVIDPIKKRRGRKK